MRTQSQTRPPRKQVLILNDGDLRETRGLCPLTIVGREVMARVDLAHVFQTYPRNTGAVQISVAAIMARPTHGPAHAMAESPTHTCFFVNEAQLGWP